MVDRTLWVFKALASMSIAPVLMLSNNVDGCIIVANYVSQLDEEEAAKYPVSTYKNYNAQNYTFATQGHSYGGQGNSNNV
jgi:hypothetical protein